MAASPLKIPLTEDDERFRLSLPMQLQQASDFEILAEPEDGETAVEIAKPLPVNIRLYRK
ncbi:MAG: hypothetical protein KME16_25180 [Scytolyngbya sp. HA4215-MV1]|jgi:two-component system NarL family response regulator|nr:hypothetical protein [Scytolyngbya sp. HA4215-MV1]